MKSKSALNDFSAGLIFGVGSVGYFAFLLSTGAQAYEAEELSFKLVHKTFIDPSEQPIIPWTRVAAEQVQLS